MATKYFKGTSKKNGSAMIFIVYNTPQSSLFDDSFMVVASKLEQTWITRYKTVEDALKENFISKEISENEYDCYRLIQLILTEMYLHDYTGGFPRKENVLDICNVLPRKIKAWLEEIES